MNEIVPIRPEAEVIRPPSRDVVDGWLPIVGSVAKLAQEIAHTEFVPGGLRGKPAAVAAAILYGREIGLGPIQSLQSVDVIDGRPAITAEMARALALSAGHEIHVAESTTTRCVARGRRAGSGEWTEVIWTMDDAKKAGLDGRPNWRRHPRRMLQARATAELCHLCFPDAVGGMTFTREEAEDQAGETSGEHAGPTRRARRQTSPSPPQTPVSSPVPAAVAAGRVDPRLKKVGASEWRAGEQALASYTPPPLPGDEEGEPRGPSNGSPNKAEERSAPNHPPAEAERTKDERDDAIAPSQLRKLQVQMRELGMTGEGSRAERLRVASALAGRTISSSKDLTMEEASAIIDALARVQAILGRTERARALAQITGDLAPQDDPQEGK